MLYQPPVTQDSEGRHKVFIEESSLEKITALGPVRDPASVNIVERWKKISDFKPESLHTPAHTHTSTC